MRPACFAAQVSVSTGELRPLGREQALDTLFAELAKAETQSQAKSIQDDIWEIWTYSGSPSVDLLMERSVEAMNSGELEHALKLLNELVLLAPAFPEAWNKRATVNYYLGDSTRSLADIAQTLAREPRHFGALSGLAMIFEDQGDFVNAAIARSKIRSLMPLVGKESPEVTADGKTEKGREKKIEE